MNSPIVGTIHINSKFLFGHTSRNVPIYLFYPFDKNLSPMRVGCSNKEGMNKVALVKFESHEKSEKYPRGVLIQLLGNAGDYVAEAQALFHQYIPLKKQIDSQPQTLIPQHEVYADWTKRGYTFNVDPPGCRDIDDCFTIEEKEDGTVLFAISIANLLELVPEGSDIDVLAQQQSVTFYENGYALGPMLPRWISEGYASFLEGTERTAITLSCSWDGTTLFPLGFEKTKIHNNKSYTYENIAQETKYAPILKEIASSLKGSLTEDPHEWIEQCMVFYNRQVADLFLKHSTGLLRSLPQLQPCRIEQKAATYVLPSKEATHAAFGDTYYTHATSPIRRYADILAQRSLAAILWNHRPHEFTSDVLMHLNTQMAQSARFERDAFFLRQMTTQPAGQVSCTVVGWRERASSPSSWKLYVEVPEWNNRLLSVPACGEPSDADHFAFQSKDERDCFTVERGECLALHYYCDLQKPNWKQRMICTLKKSL